MKQALVNIALFFISGLVLAALWLNNVEMWTANCAYKREIGIFNYYSYAEATTAAGQCGETGMHWLGLVKSLLTTVLFVFAVHYARLKIKLAKVTRG